MGWEGKETARLGTVSRRLTGHLTWLYRPVLQDPYLAVVVDPVRTMASGKVEIGAFRTYPEGYK